MSPKRFRNLKLFWKLLIPFVTVILIVGTFGAFLIVRDLNSRARAELNQDLSQLSLEVRAQLQHQELYLLDAANLSANLEGMAHAVAEKDRNEAAQLLRGVVALKTDLDLVGVATRDGTSLVEFVRTEGGEPEQRRGRDRTDITFVRSALEETGSHKHAGILPVDGHELLAVASPICSGASACSPNGISIVGVRLEPFVDQFLAGANGERRAGLAIYDRTGRLLASAGSIPKAEATARPTGSAFIRRTGSVDGSTVHILYAPLVVQGGDLGIIAVSLPSDPVFAAVRGAAMRLTFLMLAALVAIMGLGALVSRQILRQVRPLVDANRALGTGNLAARVPVLADDEIGEVARGLNQMAEQLQASHETLEMRVEQRTAEIQRLLGERTEFFASLSHELRTPLAVILNESDALLESARGTKTASARAIKMSGAQLLTVVNEILDFAKSEAGRLELELGPLSLHQAIDELAPTFAGLARTGSLTVTVAVPKDLPAVLADHQRLREILLNLVDNAVKYTPAGGRIDVTASVQGDVVEVTISDTGPGIPEEAGDRIFEPFFRVPGRKPQRDRTSSGLGLALTKQLVEAHGGSISFANVQGGGTVFTFTLRMPRMAERPAHPRRLRSKAGRAG